MRRVRQAARSSHEPGSDLPLARIPEPAWSRYERPLFIGFVAVGLIAFAAAVFAGSRRGVAERAVAGLSAVGVFVLMACLKGLRER